MKNTDILVSVLCDELMAHSQQGELAYVENTIVMLVEFAGYELARTGRSDLAVPILSSANGIERAFERAKRDAVCYAGNLEKLEAGA